MSPKKRWLAVARPEGDRWQVRVEPVGALPTLLSRLQAEAGQAPVALGIDAPIGMPLGVRGTHADFPAFLDSLTADDPLFEVCDDAAEISALRPFYPARARAGVRRTDLISALGLPDTAALLRHCDRQTETRPAAGPLFWTLGANQAGKAAISLWRDLLLPARRGADPPALWPFDGTLDSLLAARRITIAECYPAEALRQLDLALHGSKRRPADRQALAARLQACMSRLQAAPDLALQRQIDSGFGRAADGEDRFDALLGLLALLQVIREPGRDTLPESATCRWEGWILGQRVTNA